MCNTMIDRTFPSQRDVLKEACDLGLQPMCDRCHLEIDRYERFRERQGDFDREMSWSHFHRESITIDFSIEVIH